MFQPGSQVGQHGLLYSEIRFRSLAGTVVTRVCVSMLLLLISAVGHTELVCQDLCCPGACNGSWGVTYPSQGLLRALCSVALKPFAASPEPVSV